MSAPSLPARAREKRLAERARSGRLIRDSICLLSSKWSVDVLHAMERDGLVARRVHAEVPPRVEYALTSLGASMAPPLKALGSWSVAHGRQVEEARDRFDARAARAKRAA